jgi:hypothetical protein
MSRQMSRQTYSTFPIFDEETKEQHNVRIWCVGSCCSCLIGFLGIALALLTAVAQVWMIQVACDIIYQVNTGQISAGQHYYAYVIFVSSWAIKLCLAPVLICILCGCACCGICLRNSGGN